MLQPFRTKIARWAAIVAALVGAYALAGFVIAPKIVRNALLEDIPRAMDVAPSVGEIHINPFLLQAEVRDFALTGKGGGQLLGFRRLFIDFQLSSIWHRSYVFKQIDISSPYLNAVVARDGSVNLQALRPKPDPQARPPAPAAAKPLPALRVGSFHVDQGSVSYQDRSRPEPFEARLEPINFELRDFVTGIAGGLFTFTGASKLGERVEWHGHLSVQPIESDGELSIAGLQARTLWEYLQDQLNFVIDSGTIDVHSTYKFALKDAIELEMNVEKASVSDLAVKPRNSDAAWVTIPKLTATGTTVDLSQRLVHVGSVSLSGLKLLTWLEADGTVNLMQLAAKPAVPAAGTAAAVGAGAPWRMDLGQLDLDGASISAEDRRFQPAPRLVLEPLTLRIGGASLDLAKPVDVKLDTRVNGAGSVALVGRVAPLPTSGSLSVKFAGIDLKLAQPYIAQAITLQSGQLGGELQVSFAQDAKHGPALRASGDLDVEEFRTVDDTRQDDLIRWQRLDVRGLNFQQNPNRLDIAEVAVLKPYARVIIESDETLNVTNVLKGTRGHGGGRPDGTGTVKRAPPIADQAPVMPVAIKKVIFKQGVANFTDLSVAPHFSAAIQKLDGSVLGLSSEPGTRATVDLGGEVDAFSPASIKGQINLLGPVLHVDLAMDFRNIALSIFNPYSGKFAGYDITKGKLTTELHYKVDGRKLDAQHHIVIDQLEFGGKTESKEAVSLPVKLAVALLKDRNGVIDLNLPVTGSLDDPQFSLGPIIRKVLIDVLEKAVTAPFALLGSLFGGGPELQFIDFRPGAGSLDASQQDKIRTIVKALHERPQLNIEVPIAVVPELDRAALIEAEFDSEMRDAMTQAPGRRKQAAESVPNFEQLDPSAKLEVLTRAYQRAFGGDPEYPDALTAAKSKPGQISAKTDFLTSALHERLTVDDDRLKALGEQRARALQRALLADAQIDPARVFLVANEKATSKDGAVRFELTLR